jgi:hypothetical protein
MPNWCEGIMKVGGTKEQIKNFLENGCVLQAGWGYEELSTEGLVSFDDEYPDEMFLNLPENKKHLSLYVKGTHRQFFENIEDYSEQWCGFDNHSDGRGIWMCNFKGAWTINPLELLDVCKTYEIDMRIYAYERGMQFEQEMCIENGELVIDRSIEYADYVWESSNPTLGG